MLIPAKIQAFRPTAHLMIGLIFGHWILAWSALADSLPGLEEAKKARVFAQQGKYDLAIEHSSSALAKMRKAEYPNNSVIAYVLNDLSKFHYQSRELSEALKYSALALLELDTISSGAADVTQQKAYILSDRSVILLASGKLKDAEKAATDALRYFNSQQVNKQQILVLNSTLAQIYADKGEYEKAIEYLQSSIKEQGKSDLREAYSLTLRLARLNLYAEKTKTAESLINDANIFAQRFKGLSRSEIDDLSFTESLLLINQSNLPTAADKLKNLLGSTDSGTEFYPQILYQLAKVNLLQGKLIEAESLLIQSLSATRKRVGTGHVSTALILHALAIIKSNLGQYQESFEYYERVIDIFSEPGKATESRLAATQLEYSLALTKKNRVSEAEQMASSALSYFKSQPDVGIQLGYAYSAMGFVLFARKKYEPSGESFKNAIAEMEKAAGRHSIDLAPGLIKLSQIAIIENDFEKANDYINRAITILKQNEAETPYGLIQALSVKADVEYKSGDYVRARVIADEYLALLQKRIEFSQYSLYRKALFEQGELKHHFFQYLLFGIDECCANKSKVQDNKLFVAFQYPQMTSTAASVAKMAASFASGDDMLAKLLLKREELFNLSLQSESQIVSSAVGLHPTETSSAMSVDLLRKVEFEIQTIDEQIQSDFPDFKQLVRPDAVELDSIQPLLKDGEALFSHVTHGKGTYLLFVTNNTFSIKRSTLTSKQLEALVRNIRQTLDLGRVSGSVQSLPAFDVESSHFLYQKLLEPFAEEIVQTKHLIVVPDEAMQNLPFSVLVMKPPAKPIVNIRDHRNIDFLGLNLATSVLPSIGSLKYLRSVSKSSKASQPFIGFGDPLLGDVKKVEKSTTELTRDLSSSKRSKAIRSLFTRLPETKSELISLAKSSGASESNVYLSTDATETKLKQMDLDQYRVLAFATHGLLAGELPGLVEPSLVMTPPVEATDLDDGLLTASEIARLKLDADWVILSACNTASSSGNPGAEGLSGLAKAFFHAGSRSMMVSHWAIDSEASVYLSTHTLRTDDRKKGGYSKAESLRKSMLKLFYEEDHFSHPAFWAPFVIVGDGI
ncbi:CHAT domain-containing protein [Ketobacter sp.]|uniref:CHAT domain-containing protein n=1 Tax=Ketobacter sp. TaxID=2083498 RepID=UPI000F247C72|nr:CHAT domain-containing protein [Ketobacter sp.]RLU01762.1 MAG: CHAT domain-containing protein [Ketobacter sp.]